MRLAKKFLINAGILTATTFLLRTANVSFNVYISGKIGAEGMGVFQLILSVYMFAVTLATSGIGLAATRLIAEELAVGSVSGVKSATRKCLYYSVFCGILSSAVLILAAPVIANDWLHQKITVMPLYALAASLPFLAISNVLIGYFTAVRRVVKSASAQIFEQFLRIAITVYLLSLFLPNGLDYACLALVLGGAVAEFLACIYMYILYLLDKRRYRLNNAPADPLITKRMFGIAVPVALSSYIRSGLATYKQIIVPIGLEKSGISCDKAIADYGLIRGMVMPILIFPSALLSAFGSLLIPEIAHKYVLQDTTQINHITARIFKITLIFSVCVSGVMFAYADELSMAIYKNMESAEFLRIFAPVIIIMYLDDIVDALLKGLNQQVHVVGINIIDTVISIILLYILLPMQGINGYITVIFLSELLNGFLSILRLIKVTKFKFRLVWWVLIPSVVMMISLIFTKMLIKSNLVLSITCAVLIYLALMYLIGGIKKQDFVI